MRLSSTIILITWCLTFIVIASIFVAKKVVMKNRIVIRYRNSYAINLVTNSEKPKIIDFFSSTDMSTREHVRFFQQLAHQMVA